MRPANPRSTRWIRRRSSTGRAQPVKLGALEAAKSIDDIARARADAVCRPRQGRRLPAPHAGADARLHGARRAGHRALDRRRRPRAAVGLRLGARPVRAHRRHRRRRGRRGVARDGRRRRAGAAAAGRRHRGGPNRVRQGTRAAGRGRTCRFFAYRQGARARREAQRRRQPGRSRRRRAGRRVPLEDERHRRRHDPDDQRRSRRGRAELLRRWSSATTRRTSRPAPT